MSNRSLRFLVVVREIFIGGARALAVGVAILLHPVMNNDFGIGTRDSDYHSALDLSTQTLSLSSFGKGS
jgi:hypothetical protein